MVHDSDSENAPPARAHGNTDGVLGGVGLGGVNGVLGGVDTPQAQAQAHGNTDAAATRRPPGGKPWASLAGPRSAAHAAGRGGPRARDVVGLRARCVAGRAVLEPEVRPACSCRHLLTMLARGRQRLGHGDDAGVLVPVGAEAEGWSRIMSHDSDHDS